MGDLLRGGIPSTAHIVARRDVVGAGQLPGLAGVGNAAAAELASDFEDLLLLSEVERPVVVVAMVGVVVAAVVVVAVGGGAGGGKGGGGGGGGWRSASIEARRARMGLSAGTRL